MSSILPAIDLAENTRPRREVVPWPARPEWATVSRFTCGTIEHQSRTTVLPATETLPETPVYLTRIDEVDISARGVTFTPGPVVVWVGDEPLTPAAAREVLDLRALFGSTR